MNFNHLDYFITLAKVQHYTKAANLLYISQPSLTYAISSLEKELGLDLFQKEGRNVVLTEAGRIFLREIQPGMASLNSGLHKMKALRRGSGFVHIASVRTLTKSFVPQLAYTFKEQHPDKEINYEFSNSTGLSGDIINGIKNKLYDVGFCSFVENEEQIRFDPVYEQEMVILLPEDHPLAEHDTLPLEAIADEDFITFDPVSGLYLVIQQMFEAAGLNKPNIKYAVGEDETVSGLVAAEFGVAVVPNMTILNNMPVKIVHIKDNTVRRLFYLASLKNDTRLPVVDQFIDYVVSNHRIDC